MRCSKLFLTTLLTFVFIAWLATSANAVIYLDENFEGASVFQNRGFPILGTTIPVTQAILDVQGLDLRAYSSAYAQQATMIVNTGSVTSQRHFLGSKCLQLSSGQSVYTSGPFVNRPQNWVAPFQFAVSVTSDVLTLGNGTKIGSFTQSWSTDNNSTNGAETSFRIDLKVNGSVVDLICGNNNVKIGELSGEKGDWRLISVCASMGATSTSFVGTAFTLYDPLTMTYKGLQPVGDPSHFPPATNPGNAWPVLGGGIQVFVDANTTATAVRPGTGTASDLGDWGNLDNRNTTMLVGWKIEALNGGTLLIDDMFWSSNPLQNDHEQDREIAARLLPFTKRTNEGGPAATRWWPLY